MHLVGATSNLGCSVDSCYLPCEYELLDIVIFLKKSLGAVIPQYLQKSWN